MIRVISLMTASMIGIGCWAIMFIRPIPVVWLAAMTVSKADA
jgi:hypothetical protein